MTPKSARALAWFTFVIGILVSIAGNIGHAASDGMKPGEWAGAAFWPTALLLSVEILVRVRWQPEKRWMVARFTGLIVVSVVAAILSYLHLRSLLIFWQYGWFQGSIGPLAVDGLMLIAASALLSISKETPLPEEWQGTPEEISRKAFERGVHAERAAAEALPGVPVRDWADVSQISVADPDYLASLDPQDVQDDVNGPELMPEPEPKPEPEKSKLHVVKSVSKDDTESAARQAFIQSGGKLKPQDLMRQFGMSRSTAYRRVSEWTGGNGQASGRRIER